MRNKSILKLVSRFVMIIVCSLLVLFVLNICLFIGVSFQGMASGGGWQATEELTAELQENGDGTYFSRAGCVGGSCSRRDRRCCMVQ